MSIELNQVDHREFQLGQIDIKEYDINADRIIRLPLDRPKQEVTINPSIESQVITPELGKELSKVTVNPVDSTIDSNIIPRNIRAGVSVLGVDGDLQPDKPDQEKTVIPTKETQEIVADNGYELAKAIVEPIPNEYIKPEGTLDIADNGNYDVRNYANVAVTVGGENKLAKLVDGEVQDIKLSDLEGATKIKQYAFLECKKLISVEIPNSVTNIDQYAFSQCQSLISVIIPNSVTNIGNMAFQTCSVLSNITIPNSVTTIGSSAFTYCKGITEITIPDSVTNMGSSAFSNCTNLISVTIGDSLTSIKNNTFYMCSNLTSVTIGDSLTSIESYAFYGCKKLQSVTLPNGLTTLAGDAFNNCSGLKSITLPASLTSIANSFNYCGGLEKVVFEGQVPNLNNTFKNCSNVMLYDFSNCTTIPTLANVNTLGHKTGCKIVVPDALYDSWQTASVWSSVTNVTWVKASEYVE